jgi:hypothetical protein
MALNVNGEPLEFDALVKDSQLEAAIRRIEAQLQGLTRTAEKEAKAIDNLVQKAAKAIAGYATFAAGANFIQDIIRVRGEMEQLEVAFTTMLQSKEKADKLMQEIVEFAATTPFELKEVAGATKQLLAFGIPAEKIKDTLRQLGDVSAGIGQPLGEIAYLFGTIKTQGTAFTQDVRQFAQRGIPVYEELAKVLGVSVEKVGDFISAGKVGFPEIEQVFKNLTAAGSQFGGLMEAQSKTLLGQISNLRDGWEQMLNAIGKSNQGVFNDAVAGLSFLVENYQTVLDILKVLIITYGSYKAAIVATNVVQAIATNLAKGYTIAETLRYQAMLLSERAMKLLNATLLKNPAALIVSSIAALTSALIIFGRASTEASRMTKLLNDVNEEAEKAFTKEKNSLEALLKVSKDETLSKQQRQAAIKKLNELAPEYLGNLTLENLKTKEGTDAIEKYIKALQRKAKAQAISNKLTEIEGAKIDIQTKMNKAMAEGGFIAREFQQQGAKALAEADKQIKELQDMQAKALAEELAAEGDRQAAKARTLSVIDEEIKALKKAQQDESSTRARYLEFETKIKALEEERKKIAGATKSETRAAQVEENKALKLLEKRKDLLEAIAEKQRESERSGFTKQESEIDKINERYDDLIRNIDEYNKKVDEFNKKNPKNQVAKVGQLDINALNASRQNEITNQKLLDDAEAFKKNLEDRKALYERYEEARKEVGIKKAREMFGEQMKDYDSYLKLLQAETEKLLPKIQFGIANVGEVEKFKILVEAYKEANDEIEKQRVAMEMRNYAELLQVAATYNQKKAAIEDKYRRLRGALNRNADLLEYKENLKNLERAKQDELDALDNDVTRQSDLYKQLNQDILNFTRDRIKKEIDLLKDKLKVDTKLTPQQKADIQSTIDQYEGLLDATNEVAKDYKKLSEDLAAISGIFGNLGSAVADLNEGLADTLQTMGEMVSVAGNVAGAIASFASGNIIGGIGSIVGAIGGLFSLGSKARESRRKAQAELEAYQMKLMTGEIEINELYRERERSQIRVNALTLDGLKKQKDLLLEQQKAVQKQYNDVLAQLQQQNYIVDKTTEKYGGFLGAGRKTRVVNINATIGNQSFEDLEKLYTSGRLEGKAKELFELLQKIKQEGADINELLLQNQEEARQIFTGTTADSIVDAIADGFKNGLRTASDFAGNFEDLMRQAIINSLKYKYLEAPLNDFYAQFAAAAESNGELTSGEIEQLNALFKGIIQTTQQQFDQLQQISGLNLGGLNGGQANNLTGAIQSMSQQSADLIAGQFGGLRLTALDILNVSRSSLEVHQMIQANTGLTASRMLLLLEKFDRYENGTRRLKVEVI